MTHTSDKGCEATDLLDLLFDQTHILQPRDLYSHSGWPEGEDLLDTLLTCPSPSDSGISDDSPSYTPYPSAPISPGESHTLSCLPSACVCADSWDSSHTLDTERSLTVKELLLSNTSETLNPASQHTYQELILNDDEKKLLAKEGVTLSAQLPLTKYEERILKKIRRKIRNKQSAQESRKKKKEYVDSLEGRMAACSTENQELQRKVLQLEKSNMSLLEQLRRLQTLIMAGSAKPAHTCMLVLLLSFLLVLVPSLQPLSSSSVSETGDFSMTRVQSRSLHSVAEDSETITSPLSRLPLHADSGAHNGSHHGDPITGHIATVTWHNIPHADDA